VNSEKTLTCNDEGNPELSEFSFENLTVQRLSRKGVHSKLLGVEAPDILQAKK